MQVHALIIAIIGGVGAWVLMEIGTRWFSSRMASRAVDRVLRPERYTSEPRAALDPESRFVVRWSDSEVVCERPDGATERVAWKDLQRIEVVTTSDGPFLPDVFWLLRGTVGGCVIPQGATGDVDLV